MKILRILTCTMVSIAVINASDVTGWGGPSGNFSYSVNVSPDTVNNVSVKWTAQVGEGYSSVTAAAGVVYTMGYTGGRSGDDVVYALDSKTGSVKWSYKYQGTSGQYSGTRATPVIDGDTVFTVGRSGIVNAIDKNSGKLKWTVDLRSTHGVNPPSWGISASPVIDGNILILNVLSGGIALDKRDGKLIWKSSSGTGGYASAVIFTYKGKKTAAMFNGNGIVFTDISNGSQIWSYEWRTSYGVNASDPLIFDNKLFITSSYNQGCALFDLSGASPRLMWQEQNLSSMFPSVIYHNGYLYGARTDANRGYGHLMCIDPATGKELWRSENFGGITSVIRVNDKLLALSERGFLYLADAVHTHYKEVARSQKLGNNFFWTAPVIHENSIYIRNNRGDLICIALKN